MLIVEKPRKGLLKRGTKTLYEPQWGHLLIAENINAIISQSQLKRIFDALCYK